MSDPTGFALADGTWVRPQVPFFIAGSGRCGTTLMRRLLIEQAHAVIPPENYLLAVSPHLMAMAPADWTMFCRLVLTNMVKHTAHWADFGIDATAALPLFAAIPDGQRSIANFWHAFHALYARHLGKPSDARWGDKTPSSVDALPEIISSFPRARFVFMVRDVFDMAYSYGSMAAPGRAGDYLGGANRWVDANTKLLAFHEQYPAQAIIVRYEDLVRNTQQEMARVLAHLDVPLSAAIELTAAEARDMATQADLHNVLHDVRSDSIGKGRTHLAADVKAAIAAIAAIAAPLHARLSSAGVAICVWPGP